MIGSELSSNLFQLIFASFLSILVSILSKAFGESSTIEIITSIGATSASNLSDCEMVRGKPSIMTRGFLPSLPLETASSTCFPSAATSSESAMFPGQHCWQVGSIHRLQFNCLMSKRLIIFCSCVLLPDLGPPAMSYIEVSNDVLSIGRRKATHL